MFAADWASDLKDLPILCAIIFNELSLILCANYFKNILS